MRTRLLILTIFILAIPFLVLIMWLPGHMGEHLKDEVIRRGQLAAEVLDKSAIGALAINDQPALNQLAKGLIRDVDILYVIFLDKDGKVSADSGMDKATLADLQTLFPRAIRSESEWTSKPELLAPNREPAIHVCRPIYYEQLRIGTVMVGIAARRLELTVSQFRTQLVVFFGLFLVAGLLATHLVAKSFSMSLAKVSEAIASLPAEGLESLAIKDPVLTELIERIRSTITSYSDTLRELESQKLQLEGDLTRMEEENVLLNSRLSNLTKQATHQQEKMRAAEAQSREIEKLGAMIQFAATIVAEVESSMRHIGRGAEHLRQHLMRLTGLVEQLEKSIQPSTEESEQVRKYKESIGYETVKQSMDELVATIQGGAGWSEQLVDLLRQLAASGTSRGK